jgi:hypothetical protein
VKKDLLFSLFFQTSPYLTAAYYSRGRPDLSSFVTYDPRIVGGPTAEHTPSPVRSAP